ncbi:hypothetical protein D1007_11975 [Hordeum vulgare]|nr:hypothetical protein D1007_11975 [Hordeum vulgare]
MDCESIKHAFFQCPRVQEIWRVLGLLNLVNQVCDLEQDGSAVLSELLLSKSTIKSNISDVDRAELIATTVWYVWWERRSFTHGEHVAESPRSAHAISALVKNFVTARRRRPGVVRHGWQRPPDGIYKLNVDASFSEDSETGSTGAVLRSNKGVFIVGSCSDIPFAEDASSAEARALRDGLLLASEVGVQQIIVESDCQEVIDTMLLDVNSLGPAAAVYEECSFLAKNFF